MGIERTWDYLKHEFDREGNGLPDPTARYFETIGPGPQLFAVVTPSVYYHDQRQCSKTQLENYIRRLPSDSTFAHVTFIHVGFYYQNFITFFVPYAENIEFRYPVFSYGRIPLYDVHDTGKIVRECFEHPERWGHRQTVPIVAEQLTMDEICETIREVSGKDIHFVPLSYDEALIKLHRETVNNLRWYNDFGSIDEQQVAKTKEIYPKIKTFAEWVRETQWLME
ncbi:unnamed protein product [Rotaria sp. Silwood1]|nr:unnamed protein product [Rotaria sp. Silwood1]CAF3707375.1 unnamed protein product [Rotaria sp. Silwood1]CAF3742909.1 unnamed protein product [Rotaria sp. Silwood1]CAF4849307.1 unnamed protein product [Rotaria sp. Silwood1]CAF4868967.1 unnamed protein product [Rotaria sp. Silwood1]